MANYKKGNLPNRFQVGEQAALKEMNWDLLDSLIGIFCTLEECAACLDLDQDTINNKIKQKYGITFSDYFRQKASKGRASLRRRQFEMSKTNPALAIWLGKQYLGHRESPLIDQSSHLHVTTIKDAIQYANNGIGKAEDTIGPRKLAK